MSLSMCPMSLQGGDSSSSPGESCPSASDVHLFLSAREQYSRTPRTCSHKKDEGRQDLAYANLESYENQKR
uniref:HDC01185 n=1 Tax=Drosophila melanogaster TaxID=7227 RepID=Q6IHS8_DROME|nr:TPA_inf: HDC01185 [Drosophila melanogaster]